MANRKVTQLTELATVGDDDWLYVVDTSDISDSSGGTSKKAKAKNARGWPQTSAESSAGVTPTNYQYEPGDVRRYGATGDGSTNDATAINNALSVASVSGGVVYGNPGDTYRIQATLEVGSNTIAENLNILVDGDTFTAASSPTAIIQNATFSTLAAADTNITIRNCKITLDNNTASLSPKAIMLGGVKRAWVQDNEITIAGAKHSSAIECYKSTQDIFIQNNVIDIQTGNVTGGGIWLTNKTSTETSNSIYVINNTIRQDCIDELIAVFPVAGPMEDIHITENTLIRLDQGATTGPVVRAFVGDGLTGGAAGTAQLNRCFIKNNIIQQNRSTYTTSGAVQLGNATTDTVDPTYIYLENNLITGIYTSSAIAVRGLLNAATGTMFIRNNEIIYESGSGAPTGLSASDGAVVDGNKVVDFSSGINTFSVTNCTVTGGATGITFRTVCDGNKVTGQTSRCASLRTTGSGVYPVVRNNIFVPAINADCISIDTSTGSATMEYADIQGNLFDGTATGIQAIVKAGTETITDTKIRDNTYIGIAAANLWPNTIDAIVDLEWGATPESNINGSVGSRVYRTNGGAGTTLYIKESGTSNTGWVISSSSDGTTGGTGSAGAGNQYVELNINGSTYKVLHDGTV